MKGMTIAGRKTGLRFDVQAWLEVEEAFGSLEAMIRRMDEGERPMEAALTLAAVSAEGESTVTDLRFIDRGYSGFEYKLRAAGARIRRVRV